MRTKIAGVAMAAVVGVCGGLDGHVTPAKAATFSANGAFTVAAPGAGNFSLDFDTATKAASFRENETIQELSGEIDLASVTANGSLTSLTVLSTAADGFSIRFTIAATSALFTFDSTLGSGSYTSAFTQTFEASASRLSGTSSDLTGAVNFTDFFGFSIDPEDVRISAVGLTPYVPLPASAPLFGAGLVGLAGLSYSKRRRSTAPARRMA